MTTEQTNINCATIIFKQLDDAIADHLGDYLHATARNHPQPPHQASYNANLLIDQVSFTATPFAPTTENRYSKHPSPVSSFTEQD